MVVSEDPGSESISPSRGRGGVVSPAVLQDEEDVVPEGVAVLLQDPATVVQNLEREQRV